MSFPAALARLGRRAPGSSGARLGRTGVMPALLLDGPLGQRFCFESFVRDRHAALDRSAVRAGREPLLGPLDSLQLVAEIIDQGSFDHLGGELAGGIRIARLLALLNAFGFELAGQLTERGFD